MPIALHGGAVRLFNGGIVVSGGVSAPVDELPTTTLHTITLANESASASTVLHRTGVVFEEGEVPAGASIAVRRASGDDVIGYMCDANHWADGSVRKATVVWRDTSGLGGSASQAYEVYAINAPTPASSFDPWAYIAAMDDDLTVEIRNRTGFTTGAMADLDFGLQAACLQEARREALIDTPLFVRVRAWQKLSGEEHLVAIWHVDFWLDTDAATPIAMEWSVVLSQHWWVAAPFGTTQTKQRQTYDATVKRGDTAVQALTGLAHAYYCRWASLRTDDDHWHARKHWVSISAAMPTLTRSYSDASRQKMMRSGLLPPYKLGVTYATNAYALSTTYTPLGTNSHRAAINGKGGYMGRGLMPDSDGKALVEQTATRWRQARVAAQAGLSAHFHVEDHRIPTGKSDPACRPFPPAMRKITPQSYLNLAAPTVVVKGTGGSISQATATGGTGSFTSYDGAHNVPYSAFMAFAEGEQYLYESAIYAFDTCLREYTYNAIGHDRTRFYADPGTFTARATAQSIPTGTSHQWGQTLSITAQDRHFAWAFNELAWLYGLMPTSDKWHPVLKDIVRNHDAFLTASYDYYPESHWGRGGAWTRSNYGGLCAPWMDAWQGMATMRVERLCAGLLTENSRGRTGFGDATFLSGRLVLDLMQNRPYAGQAYRALWGSDGTALNPLPSGEHGVFVPASCSGSVVTIDHDWFGFGVSDGDKIRPVPNNDQGVSRPIPPELTAGTLYYAVEASGSTCKLATTLGGSPLTLTDTTGWNLHIVNEETATLEEIGPQGVREMPNDDDYAMILAAAAECHFGNGHPDVTEQGKARLRTFMAPKWSVIGQASGFSSWMLDGDNLL